jgi:hypothetical protein
VHMLGNLNCLWSQEGKRGNSLDSSKKYLY